MVHVEEAAFRGYRSFPSLMSEGLPEFSQRRGSGSGRRCRDIELECELKYNMNYTRATGWRSVLAPNAGSAVNLYYVGAAAACLFFLTGGSGPAFARPTWRGSVQVVCFVVWLRLCEVRS